MSKVIEVEQLSFSFDSKTILHELSLTIGQGECVALVGSSGSGKTTLLKLLTSLLQPQSGSISFFPLSPEISYLSQEETLLPWRTVLENVLLPFELQNRALPCDRAVNLLKKCGLAEYRDQLPSKLSGGMRKMVQFIRILLEERPIIFLDEPFGAIDLYIREQLMILLKEEVKKSLKTLLFVTHDFNDALLLSERILFLAKGKVVEELKVPSTLSLQTEQVGAFQGTMRQLFADHYPTALQGVLHVSE